MQQQKHVCSCPKKKTDINTALNLSISKNLSADTYVSSNCMILNQTSGFIPFSLQQKHRTLNLNCIWFFMVPNPFISLLPISPYHHQHPTNNYLWFTSLDIQENHSHHMKAINSQLQGWNQTCTSQTIDTCLTFKQNMAREFKRENHTSHILSDKVNVVLVVNPKLVSIVCKFSELSFAC